MHKNYILLERYIVLLLFCTVALVDLTPPTVILTSFPHLILNATEWSFTYECTDEMGCSFSCSAHEVGQLSQFSPCGTSYHVDGLINGRNYEFEVIAIDIVGNEGHLAYQWKIGKCACLLLSALRLELLVHAHVVTQC